MIQKIHETGKRENNEDFVLIDTQSKIYIVCDGVGGSSKGEEASKLAANSFKDFLVVREKVNPSSLKEALKFTEKKFDEFTSDKPESEGMATTLTFLHLYEDGTVIVAHCGDSRIYQIRDGKILFKTKDHSFVQELVDSGYITEEEALNHPKRNRITRAVQGSKKPTQLDIALLEDVKTNDFFLLCSDGILEGIDEKFISEKFVKDVDIETIKTEIIQKCVEHSNDNFSAILLEIEDNPNKTTILTSKVKEKELSEVTDQTGIPLSEQEKPQQKTSYKKIKEKGSHKRKVNIYKYISLLLLLIVIGGGIYFFYQKSDNPKNNEITVDSPSQEGNKNTDKGEEGTKDKNISEDQERKKQELIQEKDWRKDFDKEFDRLIKDGKISIKKKIEGLKKLRDQYNDKQDAVEEIDSKIKELEALNKKSEFEEANNNNKEIDDNSKKDKEKKDNEIIEEKDSKENDQEGGESIDKEEPENEN